MIHLICNGSRNVCLEGLNMDEQPNSYSGFLTVDKSYDSNMFFWFVPATVSRTVGKMPTF